MSFSDPIRKGLTDKLSIGRLGAMARWEKTRQVHRITRCQMKTLVFLATVGISMVGMFTTDSEAQVACFDYGSTLSCDGPRGNRSITEFSRGQGIIQSEGSTIPYSIIGQQEERRSSAIRPLRKLDPLPSYRDERPSYREERSSTFEERQAIRDSGRVPW